MVYNSNQRTKRYTTYCNSSYLRCGALPKSIRIKSKKKKVKTLRETIMQFLRKAFKINI